VRRCVACYCKIRYSKYSFLKLTEVYTALLKKQVGLRTSTESTINDITFPTFQLEIMSYATSTAFLLEDENDKDNSVGRNLKDFFLFS